MTAEEALRASLPAAVTWLRNEDTAELPAGTVAGARGLAATAELVAAGAGKVRDELTRFAIKVGTRAWMMPRDVCDDWTATTRPRRLCGMLG